jgi:hypothetical protein
MGRPAWAVEDKVWKMIIVNKKRVSSLNKL